MTRPLLYILLLVAVFSCKKKEQNDSPTSASQNPQPVNYYYNFSTKLMLTRNGNSFDTSFAFQGMYTKRVGSVDTYSSFPIVNYNGYLANANNNYYAEIFSSSNFIQLANQSTWNITSTEVGNFQYIDSFPILYISTDFTKIPNTYDASQGIPIKIAGFKTGSNVATADKSGIYFPNYIRQYTGASFPSTLDTIRDTIRAPELSDIPINTNFTLSIICVHGYSEIINGHSSSIAKPTQYFYPIKRIN